MNLFETTLRQRATTEETAKLLLAQWEFDRRLIGQGLQSVQGLFGNYSRHDASHSETILTQVSKVLGTERIHRLSSSDLWLMLASAYHHDIGMVVADAEAREWWNNGKLKVHLDELVDHPDAEYRTAALVLLSPFDSRHASADWPFEIKRALLLALSDYARKHHAVRAEHIVNHPESIGIASPRAIIPPRLFALLGSVCAAHGLSFDAAMLLPFAEQGVGMDDLHPRFVGAMLRLGDLLDIDGGRFCPVMAKTFGPLPPSSEAHRRKHAAIKHLLVQEERIEVDATCEDEASFDESERWLEWLRSEIRHLAAHWPEIAPMKNFGVLPCLGKVQARLPNQILLEGRRPRFEIDRENLLGLMRGNNIYSNKYAAVRELLQNAVDATQLQVWSDNPRAVQDAEDGARADSTRNPLESLASVLAGYPIEVSVEQVAATIPTPAGEDPAMRIRLRIRDRGTGIARKDIPYLQSIGGSRKNPDRRRAKREMPEWLKPSGVFGIGLQSAFLLTDRIEIISRARDAEVLALELRRSNAELAGGLIVKAAQGANVEFLRGTQVTVEFDVAAIPHRVSIGHDPEVMRVLAEFDPIVDQKMGYEAACIRAEIRDFSTEAMMPIRIDGATRVVDKAPEHVGEPASSEATSGTMEEERFYHSPSSTLIQFAPAHNGRTEAYFRGVAFELGWNAHLLSLKVDFRSGEARDLLQLSREKPSPEGRELFVTRIDEAMGEALPIFFKSLIQDPQKGTAKYRAAAALLAQVHPSGEAFRQKLPEWKALACVDGMSEERSFGQLMNDAPFTMVVGGGSDEKPTWDPSTRVLATRRGPTELLFRILQTNGYYLLLTATAVRERELGERIKYSETEHTYSCSTDLAAAGITEAAFVAVLMNYKGSHVGGRCAMPCPAEYPELQLPEDVSHKTWVGRLLGEIKGPRMILPFFFDVRNPKTPSITIPALGELARWVGERASQSASPGSIAQAYLRLIRRVDADADEEWKARRRYTLSDVEYEAAQVS